jgi:hypothetical protein
MKKSRRQFLKSATIVAVAAAIPQTLEKVVGAQPITSTNSDLFPVPIEAETDPLYNYRRSSFQPYVNSIFEVSNGGAWVPLTLSTVADTGIPESGKKKRQVTTDVTQEHRFSLLFLGSMDTPLRQDTYNIRHAALGSFRMLLVPVLTRVRDGYSYEAIINRVLK